MLNLNPFIALANATTVAELRQYISGGAATLCFTQQWLQERLDACPHPFYLNQLIAGGWVWQISHKDFSGNALYQPISRYAGYIWQSKQLVAGSIPSTVPQHGSTIGGNATLVFYTHANGELLLNGRDAELGDVQHQLVFDRETNTYISTSGKLIRIATFKCSQSGSAAILMEFEQAASVDATIVQKAISHSHS